MHFNAQTVLLYNVLLGVRYDSVGVDNRKIGDLLLVSRYFYFRLSVNNKLKCLRLNRDREERRKCHSK